MVNTITNGSFKTEVLESDKPVLIDFWASWCGPCRMLGPIIETIANERGDIKVCKVNVDEEPELASMFGIMSIPTVVAIKNGQVVNKAIGVRPKEALTAMLD